MSETFNEEQAHKFFSATCFNRAWDLIDKTDRTADEDETLINMCHASLWHWSCRPDCTDQNRSIGYWQMSRVYALVGQPDNARRFGEKCLSVSQAEGPFFLGYAYEALARSEKLAGDSTKASELIERARSQAEQVTEEADRKMLLDDIASLA